MDMGVHPFAGQGTGVGQEHDGRLQALGAVDGQHPDLVTAAFHLALDLRLARFKPVQEAFERRLMFALEIKGKAQERVDRLARLGA